jgi:anionic cell wall polymer biosynthesis LytR-Cps2A-Psr (LCP) family protein
LEKQFPCRYETVAYTVGTHHMDGGETLKFVRSRHSSSDFARGERAQAVLESLKDKLISLGAIDDLPGFFQDLAVHTTTDLDTDAVTYLAPTLASLPQLKVVNLGLTTANVLQGGSSAQGASVLIPKSGQDNWAGVHAFIQQSLP